MTKKRTVLKVPITCQKCQTDIMKAVAKLTGVDKMDVDAGRGILTIVGEVDPALIFKKLKKIGKAPEILSVGPPIYSPPCPPWCTCSLCHPSRPSYYKRYDVVPMSYSYPSYPSYSHETGQCSIL